jgi:hypothetical protein
MLDYRIHYAILATEDRIRSRQRQSPFRAAQRILRLTGATAARRAGGR